ncbi:MULTISPECIES: catechol 1,2-dioxygenase [Streptomyces]|uniref:DODA-type extradiol aromatic ring-opening family dioxygenase n=1 Tax=Streptomyces TaxID=1883 RepID=UPI000A3616E2|nr:MULTISPECIES: catechol 1,2-dioxygenase [Streptomyces]CAD5932852.1 2,3-dihydroxyphenylpropionate 1,2-dioxygenase [Streptomyces sp. KY70]CAD5988361.1 2,3-dihydroxyphenylpropionate 1,2-dioxygenase [Streptomyces sp. KY75]
MSEIVLGVGASHSTLMNTHWEETLHKDRAERFRDALRAARDELARTRPDTVVLIGSNHFRGFWLDLIPPFTLGVGECIASGESGTPKGPQPVDVPLAQHIADSLVESGRFDPAFSARLQIDHGQSHAIQYLLDGLDVKIVPLVVNVFAHPLPTLERCDQLGRAIRDAVLAFPGDRRVAVVGSGGLSHRLPWPNWREPHGTDEEFMVGAWLNGRENWQDYDARRREIIRAAEASLTPEFDNEFLTLLERGEAHRITDFTSEELEKAAGNGAQELRTWLLMAAALGHAPARRLAYEPMPEWLTGMGVAVIDPVDADPAQPA